MIGGRGLEVYDIANNQITGATFLGTVGLEWQFAGVAPVHGPGASDLVLRKVNTGQFEVYDIANNQLTGASSLGSVGLDWQVRGFAAGPPSSAGHLSHEPLGLGIMMTHARGRTRSYLARMALARGGTWTRDSQRQKFLNRSGANSV
jgi:hypothetical protein